MIQKEILFTKNQIQNKIKDIANQINLDLLDIEEEVICICILNGAIFFFSDLCKKISFPIKLDFIKVSSYGSKTKSNGFIKFTKDLDINIYNKRVIIIEDIIDTGLTIQQLIKKLKENKPKDIKICTLINKLERREHNVQIDYSGFEIKEGFVIGYGMDLNENFRALENIYILDSL